VERVVPIEPKRLASSIAIFGDEATQGPDVKQAAASLGAVFINATESGAGGGTGNGPASDLINERFDVVVTKIEDIEQNIAAIRHLASFSPIKVVVVGSPSADATPRVIQLIGQVAIVAWVESFSSVEFQNRTLQALADALEAKQASESLSMYLEHNESLQRLSTELETRIEDRRTELNESTWRLQQSQRRGEIMQRALTAVHVSHSIPEMERQLLQILHPKNHAATDAPNVEWVRIAFAAQSRLESAPMDARVGTVFSSSLGDNGHIYFGRAPEKPFRSDDKSFLTPIAEAVALAVTRLRSLERMEQIKREWEETFNAIVTPVAVLDDQLRLVRGNRALMKGRSPEQVVGRPCYEAAFGRTQACPGCLVMQDYTGGKLRNRGRNFVNARTMQFRVGPLVDKTFEVSSRPLRQVERRDSSLAESAESPLLVHLYRDATTTARFEKRIVESSKMAELGTIGSSIAHQLNNPIGGMLSHIQLLLMDMKTLEFKGKDELTNELKEMESGTRRCAEIVRDLLGFTRRADEIEAHEHDLSEIVEQAIKITELQTRSRGIRYRLDMTGATEGSLLVKGRFNLLTQAVRAVLLALLPNGLRDHQIELFITSNPQGLEIRTSVDVVRAPGEIHESLDLTVAEQILTEHGGTLQISKNERVQQAILSLPHPKV
jgi:two-component system, NtrC family, sensor kinase